MCSTHDLKVQSQEYSCTNSSEALEKVRKGPRPTGTVQSSWLPENETAPRPFNPSNPLPCLTSIHYVGQEQSIIQSMVGSDWKPLIGTNGCNIKRIWIVAWSMTRTYDQWHWQEWSHPVCRTVTSHKVSSGKSGQHGHHQSAHHHHRSRKQSHKVSR